MNGVFGHSAARLPHTLSLNRNIGSTLCSLPARDCIDAFNSISITKSLIPTTEKKISIFLTVIFGADRGFGSLRWIMQTAGN